MKILWGWVAYSLVEEWYYFIGLISENILSEKSKGFGKFLYVPGIIIDSYLCNHYDYIGKYNEIQEKVNNHILIKNEINLVDDDLSFAIANSNLENDKIIKARVLNYMNHNILNRL